MSTSTTPQSTETNFIILPTTLADASAVRAVNERSFGPTSFNNYIFPPSRAHLTPQEDVRAWRADRLRKMLQKGDMLHFKCVPEGEEGKVVGYAVWYRPGHFSKGKTLGEAFGPEKEGKGEEGEDVGGDVKAVPESDLTGVKPAGEKKEEEKKDFPAAMDMEVYNDTLRIMDEERKKLWGDDSNYWYLGGLAVDPDYQGRGLARKLVEMGLEWADNDGVPTYLEATPEGGKMYPRFGFKKIGEHAFFGGEYITEFNLRQPHASELKTVGAKKQ